MTVLLDEENSLKKDLTSKRRHLANQPHPRYNVITARPTNRHRSSQKQYAGQNRSRKLTDNRASSKDAALLANSHS